jgi:hypothetical protein
MMMMGKGDSPPRLHSAQMLPRRNPATRLIA